MKIAKFKIFVFLRKIFKIKFSIGPLFSDASQKFICKNLYFKYIFNW